MSQSFVGDGYIYVCVLEKPPLPELWSEGGGSENLGSGSNMLASGLVCAFSGGAGGGAPDSTLF